MKKLLTLLAAVASINAFAEANVAPINPPLDLNHLECHCEKHGMILDIKNGESIQEMSKHCLINENKKDSAVKFFDDNSKRTVKCEVKDDKLVLKSCKVLKHNTMNYKHMSTQDMSGMNMSNASASK
ncbi:MAG: hypothetical protein EKK64_09510 [Neisseriaceae bacterium]|jgi:hypothetical protein|nr:MAG: hypothetical protein EKK64_09510 [Neisseriaceae bacterium]